MTLSYSVNSFSDTFQALRYSFTSESRSSAPCSTRRNAAAAATGLLMEATWTRYAGTYHLLSDKGVHYDAVVRKKIDRFFMTVIDPDDRSVVFTTDLVQEYLDTFSVDRGFDPLEPDLSIQPAVTFISRDTSGHRTMWLRNRGIVGERVMRPIRADRRVAPD